MDKARSENGAAGSLSITLTILRGTATGHPDLTATIYDASAGARESRRSPIIKKENPMATQIIKAPPITVEQYEVFEGFPGLRDELINGEIVLSPQPKPLHQQVSENIHRLLNALLSDQFVAKQNSNIKLREANSMPAPDVFVVPRADWKRACESDQYLEGPPVLAVEVISPANRKIRVAQKIDLYLSNRVLAVWVCYPKKRLLRTYQTTGIVELSETETVVLPLPLLGEIKVHDMFLLD